MLTFMAGFKSRIKMVSLILQCKSERPEARIKQDDHVDREVGLGFIEFQE